MPDNREKFVHEIEVVSNVDELLSQIEDSISKSTEEITKGVDVLRRSAEKAVSDVEGVTKSYADLGKTMRKSVDVDIFNKINTSMNKTNSILKDLDSSKLAEAFSETDKKVLEGYVDEINQLQNINFSGLNSNELENFNNKLTEITSKVNNLLSKMKGLKFPGDEIPGVLGVPTPEAPEIPETKIPTPEAPEIGADTSSLKNKIQEARQGFKELEKQFSQSFKINPDSVKNVKDMSAVLGNVNTSLKDIEIEKIAEIVPEAAKELVKQFNELDNVQQQLKDPDLGQEQMTMLKEKAFNATNAIAGIRKIYGEVVDISGNLEKELNILEGVEAPENAVENFSEIQDKIRLINVSLKAAAENGELAGDTFESLKQQAGSLLKEANQLKDVYGIEDIDEKVKKITEEQKEQLETTKEYIKQKERERQLLEDKLVLEGKMTRAQAKKFARREIQVPETPQMSTKVKGVGAKIAAPFEKLGKKLKPVTDSFGKLTGTITKLLPPVTALVGAFGGIVAFGAAMLFMEKKIKDARREFIALAAETGELNKKLEETGGNAADIASDIEKWRKTTLNFIKTYGLSQEEVQQGYKDLVAAGLGVEESVENFGDLYAQSVLLGKSMSETAGLAGKLKLEFGEMSADIDDAFHLFRKQAADAGIHVSRFLDKVINSATGLAIFGGKISEVSEAFSGLAKNMALPQEAAAEAAGELTSKFRNLDSTQKVLIGDLSGYAGAVETLLNQLEKGGPITEEAATALKNLGFSNEAIENFKKQGSKGIREALGDVGFNNRDIKNIQHATDPIERTLAIMERMDIGNQVEAMTQALAKQVGIDINKSDIKDINKMFQAFGFKLGKIGESLGLDEKTVKAIQKVTEGLAANKDAQEQLTAETKKIKMEDPERAKKLEEIAQNIIEGDEILKTKFSESNKKSAKAFIDALDTGMQDSMKFEEKLQTELNKEEDERVAKALRQQTIATFDALEMNIAKILENIYTAVEPIVGTIKRWMAPLGTILKKGFLWIAKVYNFLSGGGAEEFIIEQELELQTLEAQKELENLQQGLSDFSSTASSARRDVERLTKKQKAGKELSKGELNLLKRRTKWLQKNVSWDGENIDSIQALINAKRESMKANIKAAETEATAANKREKVLKGMAKTDLAGVQEIVKQRKKVTKEKRKAEKAKSRIAAAEAVEENLGGYMGFTPMGTSLIKESERLKTKAERAKQAAEKAEVKLNKALTRAGLNKSKESAKPTESKSTAVVTIPDYTQMAETPSPIIPIAPDINMQDAPKVNIDNASLEPKTIVPTENVTNEGESTVINDNRTFNMNINQRDLQTIQQVVRGENYIKEQRKRK